MAVSKKSLTKPAAARKSTKAAKSTKTAVAPAGKMETTMRVAKTATLARNFIAPF